MGQIEPIRAVAIYKRIQKEGPALMQLYPKLAEVCRKMGFWEEASSQYPQGMEESVTKGMRRQVISKPRTTKGNSPHGKGDFKFSIKKPEIIMKNKIQCPGFSPAQPATGF